MLRWNRELLSGDKEGLIKLPSDTALIEDPVFRPLVEKYAAVCLQLDVLSSFRRILWGHQRWKHLFLQSSNREAPLDVSGWGCILLGLWRSSPEAVGARVSQRPHSAQYNSTAVFLWLPHLLFTICSLLVYLRFLHISVLAHGDGTNPFPPFPTTWTRFADA